MPSQYNESEIIKRFFGDKKEGRYIDIGAGDPVIHSNTYELYQKDWRGILVEPFYIYHDAIKEKRPKDILEPIAIADFTGTALMCNTAMNGTWIGDEYLREYESGIREKDGRIHQPYSVPCMTMNDFVKKYKDYVNVDFLTMDIETGEEKALAVCDFNIFKPKLMCIEYRVRGVDQRRKWERFIYPFYIQVDRTEGNVFYLRKEYASFNL